MNSHLLYFLPKRGATITLRCKNPALTSCPLCAKSRLMHCSKKCLFDHLVGAAEQRNRHGDAESLGGLEIDDKFNFR